MKCLLQCCCPSDCVCVCVAHSQVSYGGSVYDVVALLLGPYAGVSTASLLLLLPR